MSLLPNSPSDDLILHIDCFSGIAGDMVNAALIDLGVPLEVIESAAKSLPLEGYTIRIEKEKRQSIEATRFFVDVDESKQPHRHFSDIREMIQGADLEAPVKKMSVEIFEAIAKAEARVHGSTVDHVHFHEVGAVDSIIDIVGAAAALHHIGAKVTCTRVPLGSGMIKTQHGVIPVPAPATLFVLEGVPVEGTEIQTELVTPTGAAIVKAAASSFGRFPKMVPMKVGFGAGSRTHETRPGLLRVVLGTVGCDGMGHGPSCVVVEANVDDMTGEVAAAAAAKLLEEGALDAWFEPIQMKKGRPALKLSVLSRRANLDAMAGTLFRETSTIGLRYYEVGRVEMERSMAVVETPFGEIKVKVAKGPGGAVNAAPEFEDCNRAAKEHGVPLKQVMTVAAGIAQKLLE